MVQLGIDSGARNAGFAIVAQGEPVYASAVGLTGQWTQTDVVRLQLEVARAARHLPTSVAIEQPRVWGRTHKGRRLDANALIRVALGAGLIFGLCVAAGLPVPVYVLPGEWTLKKSKESRHDKLRASYGSDLSRLLYPTPRALTEHALDALGIALWCYGVHAEHDARVEQTQTQTQDN